MNTCAISKGSVHFAAKMATHALASMLDELMGRNRNLAPSDQRNDPRWDDQEVVMQMIQLSDVGYQPVHFDFVTMLRHCCVYDGL